MNGINGKNETFRFAENGFDWIRQWAAVSVMLLHYTAYAMEAGQPEGVMMALRKTAGFFPGVVVLFALSGYLVSASRDHSRSVKDFSLRRVLRLFPELWVCTLVNLAVIAALAGELLDASLLKWIPTQILGIANTPDCLKSFATGSVNGSLWSIFVMIQLYGTLCLLHGWFRRLNMKGWIVLIAAATAVNIGCDLVQGMLPSVLSKLMERTFVPYALWFLIGVFCYYQRERVVPVLKKWTLPLLIAYCAVHWLGGAGVGYYADAAIGLICPFLVIGGGYCLPKVRLRADPSYGIFLYHWIVLNVWVHCGFLTDWPWPVGLAAYALITITVSLLSWRFVGQPTGKALKRMMRSENNA